MRLALSVEDEALPAPARPAVVLTEAETLALQRAQTKDGESLEETLLRLAGLRPKVAPEDRRAEDFPPPHLPNAGPPADAIFRVKAVREATLCGLKEAKEAVEACGYDAGAAATLLRAVGVDHLGRRERPWTAQDLEDALRPAPVHPEASRHKDRGEDLRGMGPGLRFWGKP